jgi:hypothetical protein
LIDFNEPLFGTSKKMLERDLAGAIVPRIHPANDTAQSRYGSTT